MYACNCKWIFQLAQALLVIYKIHYRKTPYYGSIYGLNLYPSNPPSAHQGYVDDTLLMGSPLVKEALSF